MGAPALRAGAPSQRRPAPFGRWPPPNSWRREEVLYPQKRKRLRCSGGVWLTPTICGGWSHTSRTSCWEWG